MPSPLGPVRVERASDEELRDEKKGNYGDFLWMLRRIRIHESLQGPVAWQVLWHEWTHMVLMDAGITEALDERAEEVICDAVANALVLLQRSETGACTDSCTSLVSSPHR